MECNDLNVNEGAFWHTNMDLYYGHQPGEVVEVEHEPNKYWLAVIEYSFKHLILMRWVGDYGEFWIDTSSQNSATNSSNAFNHQSNAPKRLFPLGHHLQPQLRSQFILEKPTKVLVKPSFYDPAKDPYAEIKTVDDLLAFEADNDNDTLMNPNSLTTNEPTSLALAKCKARVSYGQEDVDELEAALQNLNEIDPDQNQRSNESPDDFNMTKDEAKEEQESDNAVCDIKSESYEDSGVPSSQSESSKSNQDESKVNSDQETPSQKPNDEDANSQPSEDVSFIHDETYLKLCENLQAKAINESKYQGIGKHSNKVFHMKPKQFYDLGGANQERVFVAGTVLEVCHIRESESGAKISHWFATVIKNIGGRLTLRWFLCDEPKFKQGRLELKSMKSEYIFEDSDTDSTEIPVDIFYGKDKISVKDTTFCMHFCNPCIFTIGSGKDLNRTYEMPRVICDFIYSLKDQETFERLQNAQLESVFDPRRMNLDKDRPIIDHLLAFVREMRPEFISIKFGGQTPRNVLLTCPKLTRVFKGCIKQDLGDGAFEVHSEPISESGEIIRFVYPYDNSYSVLPLDWAENNADCLSVQPSRNPSPSLKDKHTNEEVGSEENHIESDQRVSNSVENTEEVCPKTESEVQDHPDSQTSIDDLSGRQEQNPNLEDADLKQQLHASDFDCKLITDSAEFVASTFHVMQQLEVTHPSSDTTVCSGRIRKVAYPLLWIQISTDSYTLLPFNSTNIYASGWCENFDHSLMSLLPPRKRLNNSSQDKKRKKVKLIDGTEPNQETSEQAGLEYEVEDFNFDTIGPVDSDYILSEKATLTQIFFNHKCFTGPSLSKGKICSLPQYVGPGPLRLVMEEVMTKVISVAYVPPRILNDLSSKSFRDLLVARNMTNTIPMEFKAKYQKRVHREQVPVCINSNDVARYCECVCEHLKCCYNLFGPNLYDGDDCPGHCRALTKSNKFMKRATYYREKARNGEFTNDNNNAKKSSPKTTTRARYAGRDSSESTSSTISRSDQVNSRASSAGDDAPLVNDLKENLAAVQEGPDENRDSETSSVPPKTDLKIESSDNTTVNKASNVVDDDAPLKYNRKLEAHTNNGSEFKVLGTPEDWTVEDVADHMNWSGLAKFRPQMISEGIDGRALLLLDRAAIKEHFQHQQKLDITLEEVSKLCRFVEFVKSRVDG